MIRARVMPWPCGLAAGRAPLARFLPARPACPGDAGAWYNLAASERALGALEAAGEACDAAIACDGDHAASHLLRSELRVQSADDNHVDVLRAALARAPQEGRAVSRSAMRWPRNSTIWAPRLPGGLDATAAARWPAYDVATDEAKLARIAQVFTQGPELLPCRKAGAVCLHRRPAALGHDLPRTDALQPGVVSHGETDHFAQSLLGAAPRRADLDVFARAALADPAAVGRAYAGRAAAHGVIEKLPMNYLYLGAMARALHGALLAAARRSKAVLRCSARCLAMPIRSAMRWIDLARYAAWDR
jgi:hypothetical protein